jgi:hypothetical protein
MTLSAAAISITQFHVNCYGLCGTRVFRACVRIVSNGFAANSGFERIRGWRKRSAFLLVAKVKFFLKKDEPPSCQLQNAK